MSRTEIKILLLEKGLNQTKIARLIGVAPQTVCDLLAGRRKTPGHQEKIAQILNVEKDTIFDNVQD